MTTVIRRQSKLADGAINAVQELQTGGARRTIERLGS